MQTPDMAGSNMASPAMTTPGMANASAAESSRELARLSRYFYCLDGEHTRKQGAIASQPAVLDAVINGSSELEVVITFYDGASLSSPVIAQLAVAPGKTFAIGCRTGSGLSYNISAPSADTFEGQVAAPITVLYRLLTDVSGRPTM